MAHEDYRVLYWDGGLCRSYDSHDGRGVNAQDIYLADTMSHHHHYSNSYVIKGGIPSRPNLALGCGRGPGTDLAIATIMPIGLVRILHNARFIPKKWHRSCISKNHAKKMAPILHNASIRPKKPSQISIKKLAFSVLFAYILYIEKREITMNIEIFIFILTMASLFIACHFQVLIRLSRKKLKRLNLMREIQIHDDDDQFVSFDNSYVAQNLLK